MLTLAHFLLKNGSKEGFLLDLPHPIRIGDRIEFHFTLRKKFKNRTGELDIVGTWEVVSHMYVHTGRGTRQCCTLRSTMEGKEPTWRSVKNVPARPLAPCVSPSFKVTPPR